MARTLYGALLLLVALAQATVVPANNPITVQPNLALVMVLVWSALRGLPEGLAWAFALGVLFDVLAVDPLGTNPLALLPVVLLATAARRRFFTSSLLLPMGLAVAATVTHAVLLLLLRGGAGDIPLSTLLRYALLQALLNAMLVPPLYLVAAAMNRRISLRRRRFSR